MSARQRVVVLDTSAFLSGYDPFSANDEHVTVPKVEEEILRNSMIKMRFETAVESGKVKVQAPTPEAASSARMEAGRAGDVHKLSATDLQLIALALQLKNEGCSPQIVSDDYSIQNVAKHLNIDFLALATHGIKRQLEWVRYCPACFKKYPSESKFKECQVCGTELKRKPKRQ
jgi:UPF0271 protein